MAATIAHVHARKPCFISLELPTTMDFHMETSQVHGNFAELLVSFASVQLQPLELYNYFSTAAQCNGLTA